MPEYISVDGWVTLYEPRSGMAIAVPKDSVDLRISQGFSLKSPLLESHPELESVVPGLVLNNSETISVAINLASLAEIKKLGLSTAQAKAVKDRCPYKDIEDLVIKVPEVTDWGDLRYRLDFSKTPNEG